MPADVSYVNVVYFRLVAADILFPVSDWPSAIMIRYQLV